FMAVGEDVGLDYHRVADDALDGEAATVDLRVYSLDDDPPPSFCRLHTASCLLHPLTIQPARQLSGPPRPPPASVYQTPPADLTPRARRTGNAACVPATPRAPSDRSTGSRPLSEPRPARVRRGPTRASQIPFY